MRRTSSTSSFKRLPAAFLIAVAFIVCCETYVYVKLTPSFSSHEVDWLLNRLRKSNFKADYLIIGDSVGLQIARQYRKNPKFAILATNQAVETTGHYFLARRYLEKNPVPKAVFFIGLPFHFRNLDQVYTENFVLRTFTHSQEIIDIAAVTHNPVISAKMLAYKYLPTFKFRLKLQDQLVGFTNSDIYSGFDTAVKRVKTGQYSMLRILKRQVAGQNSAAVHFGELLEYLEERNVPLYYIPAPIKTQDRKDKSSNYALYQDLFTNFFPSLENRFETFHYFSQIIEHDKKNFSDGVHYTTDSLYLGERYLADKLELITGDIIPVK